MLSGKPIVETNDIDMRWPSTKLVDTIGFRTKAGNRIIDYLNRKGIREISLSAFMDLFLPTASNTFKSNSEFWGCIPIFKQPQFGPYLYDTALLTLTEVDMGDAFRAEWMLRIYSLKLHELRNKPANKRFQQTAKNRGC